MKRPDFPQLKKILLKQKADRPVLFELFFDDAVYEEITGRRFPEGTTYPDLRNLHARGLIVIDAFAKAGYDYATMHASAFDVQHNLVRGKHNGETVSLNEGAWITDRAGFRSFPWPDPASFDDSHLETLAGWLPEGMKLIVMGPGGILENVIQLTGYERLCYMLFDDPVLAEDIFRAVGERFEAYYHRVVAHGTVGAIVYNDDWGFNTGTMISPADLERLVFPHVRRIVEHTHDAGIPAIIHSCGNLYGPVMEAIIEDLRFDAKHSYEDLILPVEEAWRLLRGRIAVLGGLDVDFLVRSTPGEIEERSRRLLSLTREEGGYALGSGNSIADYIPRESFRAMRRAAGI